MTRKFKYQGPTDSSVTLKVNEDEQDVLLFRGTSVDLPEEHEYVKTLIALGYLVADEAPQAMADALESTSKKGAK